MLEMHARLAKLGYPWTVVHGGYRDSKQHGYGYVYRYRTDTDTRIRHFLRKPDTWIRFIIFYKK